MMEHGNKMILIRKGTHSVWHQPSHQSTSPLCSTLSRNDFHWIKHVSLTLYAEWEATLYVVEWLVTLHPCWTWDWKLLGSLAYNALSHWMKSWAWNCIYLSMATSLDLFIFLPKHENLYISSWERLPLKHQFDIVITAKGGLDFQMNIILFWCLTHKQDIKQPK